MTITQDTPSHWDGLRVLRIKDGHTITSLTETLRSENPDGPSFTRQYISMLERGVRRPTPPVIKALAKALHVPQSVLEKTVPDQWRDQSQGAA